MQLAMHTSRPAIAACGGTVNTGKMSSSEVVKRRALMSALRSRRAELEQVVVTETCQVGGKPLPDDIDYLKGLRLAISAAVDFGLSQLDDSSERTMGLPVPILSQARLEARNEVKVETVLRRYFAGFRSFADFLLGEADRCGFTCSEAQAIIREQTQLFDVLLAAVSREYERETYVRSGSSEERRVQRLTQLLDGEPVSTGEFDYPFGGYNLAIVMRGRCVHQLLHRVATAADRALLIARIGTEDVWVWFGGRRAFSLEEHHLIPSLLEADGATVALGEPAFGIDGWRLSHRQARAALRVAESSSAQFVRYADVAVVASAQQDRLFAASLREMYLLPLAGARDGGIKLRAALRAYIDAGGNVSSAAAALGVSRRTVTKRLEDSENRLGRPIADAIPALDSALRLQEFSERNGFGAVSA